MKSSTRVNFKSLVKDELVKRFESSVQEEIRKYDSSLEQTQNKLNELKNYHDENLSLINKLRVSSKKENEELKNEVIQFKEEIKELFNSQAKFLGKKEKEIDAALEKMSNVQDELIPRNLFEKLRENVDKNHLNLCGFLEEKEHSIKKESYEQNQNYLKYFVHEVEMLREEIDLLRANCNNLNTKLETNIVNTDGINRSIKIDEKTMHVIEKKIEYLKTKIERLAREVTV